jgi:Guanylate kinase
MAPQPEPVRQRLVRGEPVICEIELQGARQVRARDPQALLVFLAPPSWDVLVQRLTGRGTEEPEVVAERLVTARRELAAESEFDVVVVNDSVAQAAEEIVGLITG